MREVFADAAYWIAVLNPRDGLHAKAREVSRSLNKFRILTSEMVLTEVLNSLGDKGPQLREVAVHTVDSLRSNANVSVVPQTSIQFRAALRRYRDRADKDWGLTDCASFLIMEERRIRQVLAHDRHFQQAGVSRVAARRMTATARGKGNFARIFSLYRPGAAAYRSRRATRPA